MKINKLKLFGFLFVISLFSCSPSFAGGETGISNASAVIGLGTLSTIAAPVLIPAGLVQLSAGTVSGNNELTDAGGWTSLAGFMGPLVVSAGVVGLIGATGEGLSNLTDDSINAVNYSNIPANTPKAVIDVKGKKKEIPFVVRPSFVQMNEEVKQ